MGGDVVCIHGALLFEVSSDDAGRRVDAVWGYGGCEGVWHNLRLREDVDVFRVIVVGVDGGLGGSGGIGGSSRSRWGGSGESYGGGSSGGGGCGGVDMHECL